MPCSPAQLFILFLKRAGVSFCFMLSLRVFQRKLPMNDKDSTPYDIVFALEVFEGFFSKIIFHKLSLIKFQ